MILYHGSNIKIDAIDLKKGRKGKDFGHGFYLTAVKMEAAAMAKTVVQREQYGVPTLNVFNFDESVLTNGKLRVKIFNQYSLEWARFVNANRKNRSDLPVHDYDIVFGPIADDRIGLQMWRMAQGYIDEKQFEKEIEFIRPTFQYFFCTEKSLAYLRKHE